MKPSVTIHPRPGDNSVLTAAPKQVRLSTAAIGVAGMGGVIGGGIALLIASALGQSGDPTPWLAGALGGSLGFIWFGARKYERAMVPPDIPRGPMALTLTDRGMNVDHEDFQALHAWHSFTGVEETPDHIVIRTRQSGAFIVPIRDFASPEDAAVFVQALQAGIAPVGQTVA